MLKKLLCIALAILCCLPLAAFAESIANEEPTPANSDHPTYDAVPLNEDELEILDLLRDEIHIIAEEDYMDAVSELMVHTHEYQGMVFQMEGLLYSNDETLYVYRYLWDGTELVMFGLPMRYLNKEIQDGAWIRVTGILAEEENEEGHYSVLDIVAIESLTEYGLEVLDWDGSEVHSH